MSAAIRDRNAAMKKPNPYPLSPRYRVTHVNMAFEMRNITDIKNAPLLSSKYKRTRTTIRSMILQ